jgi:S-methylmethionine-dependent homocysteine/selenocysteine methylase
MRDVSERIILDGGMGRELWRRGIEVPVILWSANALLVAPDTVQQVHADYIAAGAALVGVVDRETVEPDRHRILKP